jgi:uncharacterized membrane protein YfcA
MDSSIVLLSGLAIGFILGLLGGGGGLMAIPALIYVLHYPFRTAVGTSLALVSIGALPSILLYSQKRQIHWKAALIMGCTGAFGALVGSQWASHIARQAILSLFIGLMILSAYKMLVSPALKESEVPQEKLASGLLLVSGLAIGILTGLVGVGGGFLLVPALTLFGKLEARIAMATSLLVICINAVSGVVGYLTVIPTHQFSFWLLLAGAFIGSVLGFWANFRLSPQQLKKGFGVLLILLAALLVLFPPQK